MLNQIDKDIYELRKSIKLAEVKICDITKKPGEKTEFLNWEVSIPPSSSSRIQFTYNSKNRVVVARFKVQKPHTATRYHFTISKSLTEIDNGEYGFVPKNVFVLSANGSLTAYNGVPKSVWSAFEHYQSFFVLSLLKYVNDNRKRMHYLNRVEEENQQLETYKLNLFQFIDWANKTIEAKLLVREEIEKVNAISSPEHLIETIQSLRV